MLMSYDDVAKSLSAAGVPVVRERLLSDTAAVVATVEEFACPVVLKLVSPELVHKSDVGAVLLDVRGPAAARIGSERLAALAADLSIDEDAWRILVQELVVPTAVEVFVGLKRDPVFGPIVVVGAGGKLVELKDLVLGLRPDATGEMRIRPDFEGHSTQRPLPVVVEHAADLAPDRHDALRRTVEDRVRSALNVKTVVELVPEGTLKRPDHVKVALVERQ